MCFPSPSPRGCPRGRLALLLLAVGVSAACSAPIDPVPDYDRLAAEVRRATGVQQPYHPADGADGPDARVAALLDGGLDADEAVRLGLLIHPRLQAGYRAVGVSHAERVQAGLLRNPSFVAALRLPSGGGLAAIETSLFASLADLWQLDEREAVAERALARRILEVADDAAALAAEIRVAHVEAVCVDARLVVSREHLQLAAELGALVEARVRAGAATEIEGQLARVAVLEAQVQLHDAELAREQARGRLLAALGLEQAPAELVLVPDVLDDLPPPRDDDALRALALTSRLDLRVARAWVDQADAELARQQGRGERPFDAGLSGERDDGDWAVGPAVRVELPVFDDNDAAEAAAAEDLQRRERLLAEVRLRALHEVAGASARVRSAGVVLALHADGLLPGATRALELARRGLDAGTVTLTDTLNAQRAVLTARRELVERRRDLALAVTALERAAGCVRDVLLDWPEETLP